MKFSQDLSGPWAIHPNVIDQFKVEVTKDKECSRAALVVKGFNSDSQISAQYSPEEESNVFSSWPKGSIAIIPLVGVMTKYGTWWSYGVDDIAFLIKQADASENINGIVLLINSPGGSVISTFQIVETLKNLQKPIIGLVDGVCFSAAELVRSHIKTVYALTEMCEFGSIGVMAEFSDWSKYYENLGVKTIVIYPPESPLKNKAIKEAIDGDPEMLIKEQLTPWALHFQETMKKNLSLSADIDEDMLQGKTFYAKDAVEKGWITGIKNLESVISEIQSISETRNKILNL